MLEHGGRLQQAQQLFGIPAAQWLDLSTGLLPHPYPLPPLDASLWHRLPEAPLELEQHARVYYAARQLLAVAGTQAAIQALPRLRMTRQGVARVVLAAPSYQEHVYQWQRVGHQIRQLSYAELADAVDDADVMVICNPNNPTGERIAPELLLNWAKRLAQRGGWLIVDEAFCDIHPQHSLAPFSDADGLIVLKSVGKFFGLAGLRLGFVCAEKNLLDGLQEELGPWTVSTAAQHLAGIALKDTEWQQHNRYWLCQQGARLKALLSEHSLASSGCELFQWCSDASLVGRTDQFWHFMASRGIWIRRFEAAAYRPHGVRLGLPADQAGWEKLSAALAAWSQQ